MKNNAPKKTLLAHALQSQAKFTLKGKYSLVFLTLILVAIFLIKAPYSLTQQEKKLWQQVRAAQIHLADYRTKRNINADPKADPWKLGLIGVEWSELTTTLGDLKAKRTACNPTWSVWLKRQFKTLGLKPKDKIAIFTSSSFPGLILNSLLAAESMDLDILLVVSLGSSTWGANHPKFPWPYLAQELETKGFIHKKADYYTLGGGSEKGLGLSDSARKAFILAAQKRKVPLLSAPNLKQMIKKKAALLKSFEPKVLLNIGGSHANMGNDEAIIKLEPGLIKPQPQLKAGNGVVAWALHNEIPVIHFLNLKKLSDREGIVFNADPKPQGPGKAGIFWSLLGLGVFILVMAKYQRWRIYKNNSFNN